MAEYLLSGYAYFPPVETVLAPRTETSLLTANSPRYRRKARSKLSPHFFVTYPSPPASPEVVTRERLRLVAVRTSLLSQRREPLSRLRRPVVVNASVVTVVYSGPSVRLAKPIPRRRSRPTYVYPIVVFRTQALGWTAAYLVQPRRPIILSSVLKPPVVVNP